MEDMTLVSMADIFRALGDPTRLKIVEILSHSEEICVCKITEELEMTQPAVSHHLSILKHVGLVEARRCGRWMHYSLCREALLHTIQQFMVSLAEEAHAMPSSK